MKVKQMYTKKDFEKIDKITLFELWYKHALTDKQIAVLYGITPKDVKDKRKELNIGWLNSAMLLIAGPQKFRWNVKPKIKIK